MQKVIAIVGPTASGKSALGVYLAQKFGGEIISADSRQVYRRLDIGTGKVTKKEMGGIPHHLLDVVSPKKQFSVGDFKELAEQKLIMIQHSEKIPIIVGGTGLYIDALLGRITFPNVPPNKKLREQLERHTTEELFAQLQKLDPARAKTIEPKHKRRLIRALEIATYQRRCTSPARALRAARPSLTLASRSAATLHYTVLWLGLNPGEKKLKQNIHTRLQVRIKIGMIGEAKRLHVQGLSYKRMEKLGLEYRYLAQFLQNKITKAEMTEQIERASYKYAKRQMRWFKRNEEIVWVKGKTDALRLAKKFTLQPSRRRR